MFIKRLLGHWTPIPAGIIIGLSGLFAYFVYDTKPMCIGCYLGDVLAYAEYLFFGKNSLIRSDIIDIRTPLIGILLGSFAASFLSREFKIRKGKTPVIIMSLIGGFLAGFGTFLAGGCTIRHIIIGIPAFLANSWIAAVGIVGGIYSGTLMLTWWSKR